MADTAIIFAVKKLGDALIHKLNSLRGVEDQVRWLKDELQNMQCFLKDAEEKQDSDERIRQWISEVREVAQDAEDAIEIFTLKVDDTPTRKRDLLRKWAGFPSHVSHLNRVRKEIKSIRTRLDEIAKRRERYGIRNLGDVGMESSSTSRSEIVELQRRMRARLQKDKDVVGLNEDTDLLVNKVILDDKRKGLSLAAIVGMGGIGKSTLARKIYNHPAIADRFEKRAWVVVSSEFAAEDIMKQIMHELSVPLDDVELKTLESIQGKLRRQELLQQMLQKRLEGKQYFLVLDDMWEHTHWGALETAFPNEHGKASRLLFTSRNQIITEHRGYIHKMKLLNSDESWELLLKTSFVDRGEGRCPDELKDIGSDILKNCHGLPLAITVAGGLLVNQGESNRGWERVLKQIKNYYSKTSDIGTDSVSTILELSYQNLPSHLKPCFLCLAFFREDATIRAKRLVHIWVALGLVKVQGGGDKSVEEIASSYLDELINRNLILVKSMSIDDAMKYCSVHDLLRELSIRKAREEIGFESITNEDHEGSSLSSYKPRARHRVVVQGFQKRQIPWNQNKHLRSLFLRAEHPDYAYTLTPSDCQGFELLRILDIEGSRLPMSMIRALIGIRYLRLREDGVLRLPSWLDDLKTLEVLDIGDCVGVIFPDVTWRMDHLRHFYMHVNKKIMYMCMPADDILFSDSMKKSSWKNLETLKYIRSDVLLFSQSLRKLGISLILNEEEELAEVGRLLAESEVQVLHLKLTSRNCKKLPILNSLDHLTKLKLYGSLYDWCPSADMFPQNITHLTLSSSYIDRDDVIQELGTPPRRDVRIEKYRDRRRWNAKAPTIGNL
ncbi:hypothetical protein ACS0TY_004813 [Phlomoides rotata]